MGDGLEYEYLTQSTESGICSKRWDSSRVTSEEAE